MPAERYEIWVNGQSVVSYSDHARARKEAQKLANKKRSVVLTDNGTGSGDFPKPLASWQDGKRFH